MQARVSSMATVPGAERSPGVVEHVLVPPIEGSTLAAGTIALVAGSALDLTDGAADQLLFVYAGTGTLRVDGVDHPVGDRCSLLVRAHRSATLVAGPEGIVALRATLGDETDLHAPMGADQPVVALEHVEAGAATGARSFQVLHGPANGSTRATAFVGYIPPGRAPWHYHLYDEIVWILSGTGRLHVGEAREDISHGAAFRLRPREVHIVENLDPAAELVVLGIFTPAGSPSAAYLEPGVAATYAIG